MITKNQEIYNSIEFFKGILEQGAEIIESIRNSKNLKEKIKGKFESGVLDYVTSADEAVRDFYVDMMKKSFPTWKFVIEDDENNLNYESLSKGEIIVFFDPIDGTDLFREGKAGYSTMASVTVKESDGLRPVLGCFKVVNGEYVYGYSFEEVKETNLFPLRKEIGCLEDMVLGRTSIERKGLLGPIAIALGCKVKNLIGIAPQTLALIKGETDLFIYEPGIRYWDIFPAIPIIELNGGSVFDFKGEPIRYNGNAEALENGFIAINSYVPKEKVIEAVKKVIKL